MAAVAKYKVRRPFVYEGRNRKIGEELILDSRVADTYYKKGLLTDEQFLDPDDPSDKGKIAEIKQKMAGVKADIANQRDERQVAREEREAEKDAEREEKEAKRKAKLEEAISLIPDDGTENVEKMQKDLEAMDIDQLEASIDDFKKREKKNPDDVDPKPSTDTPSGPNPSTKDS